MLQLKRLSAFIVYAAVDALEEHPGQDLGQLVFEVISLTIVHRIEVSLMILILSRLI